MNEPSIEKIEDDLSRLLSVEVTAELLMARASSDPAEARNNISLLDIRYEEESSDSRRKVRQTALLLEQDDFQLPDFSLRPKRKGIVGKLSKMLGDMSIEFADSPDFSSAYALIGWVEPAVRALFVREIRDYFAKDHRWSVCGHGTTLVVFMKGTVAPQADQDQFIKGALSIVELFQTGEAALDTRPDLQRETRPEDVRASTKRMGGIAGSVLSRQFDAIGIMRSQLDEFAAAQSPREIPAAMARQVIGQIGPAIVAILVAALVGIGSAIACLFVYEDIERLIAIPCFLGAILCIVGAYFVNRYRASKTRVLREGVLYSGKITEIEQTDFKLNDQRRHLVTMQSGGTTAVCRAYGVNAKLASTLKESGATVRFLVDPRDGTNVVGLDLLTVSDR